MTGEVRTFGPGVDVGAIEAEKLTDELIVAVGGLEVAIRLPDELQSADQLTEPPAFRPSSTSVKGK